MEGLVKIGPWGGRGGDPRDDIVAAGVAPHRLESVIIRCQNAVDAISFTYAGVDGAPRKAGPWGGSGGRERKVKFGATEVIKEISGTYGPFKRHACIVRSLTFVTNVGVRAVSGVNGSGSAAMSSSRSVAATASSRSGSTPCSHPLAMRGLGCSGEERSWPPWLQPS